MTSETDSLANTHLGAGAAGLPGGGPLADSTHEGSRHDLADLAACHDEMAAIDEILDALEHPRVRGTQVNPSRVGGAHS